MPPRRLRMNHLYGNEHAHLHDRAHRPRILNNDNHHHNRRPRSPYRDVHNPAVPAYNDLDRAPPENHRQGALNHGDGHSLVETTDRKDPRRLSRVSQHDFQRRGSKRDRKALSPLSSTPAQASKRRRLSRAEAVSDVSGLEESEPAKRDIQQRQQEVEAAGPASSQEAAEHATAATSSLPTSVEQTSAATEKVLNAGSERTDSEQSENDDPRIHGDDQLPEGEQTSEHSETAGAGERTNDEPGLPDKTDQTDGVTDEAPKATDEKSDSEQPDDGGPKTKTDRETEVNEETPKDRDTPGDKGEATAEGQGAISKDDACTDSNGSDDNCSDCDDEEVPPDKSATSSATGPSKTEELKQQEIKQEDSEGVKIKDEGSSGEGRNEEAHEEDVLRGKPKGERKEEPKEERKEERKEEPDAERNKSESGPTLTIGPDIWNTYMVENKHPRWVHVGIVEEPTLRERLALIKKIEGLIGSQNLLATIPDVELREKLSKTEPQAWSTPLLEVILRLLKETRDKRERDANMPGEGATDGQRIEWLMGEVGKAE